MKDALYFIRGLVRPVVTLGLVGAAVAAVFIGKLEPEWLAGSASLIVGFWFHERANRES